MAPRLKRLAEQVVVVTGASSGIGLTTAELAACAGARVILSSRNERDLLHAVIRIRAGGGRAFHVVADVADPDAVDRIADVAIEQFGGIDTWVNNAGIGMYGKLTETPLADKRRLFDVDFWGVVHGCRTAVRHMRAPGGAIINVGSVASNRAAPLLGIYSAAKHAVKAYTDTLRRELVGTLAPRTMDAYLHATAFRQQKQIRENDGVDALDTPQLDGRRRGPTRRLTLQRSAYTRFSISRARRALPLLAAGALAAGLAFTLPRRTADQQQPGENSHGHT